MPTPVCSARQCLAADAASALDDAVSAARRRSHAQTTSLHVVFALLSSSSPPLLRDALSRSRSSSYSPRLQFKALDLCFGVALDRLPSSSSPSSAPADDPPVSNSLMAAVKRSQANQRRHPDTFHFYQQQQLNCSSSSSSTSPSSSSSFSGVKVELQQLVLAILDDPVVSRVFGEAGFRSPDIKLAVLRPPPPILRFPRAARCPPLFLCNFSAGDDFDTLTLTSKGFGFPLSDAGDENCRRIGEVLVKRSNRNPMLVGVGAVEAARDFARNLERESWVFLPAELAAAGLRFVSLEGAGLEAGGEGFRGRLEEVGRKKEGEVGVVVGIGDLKGLVDLGEDLVNSLVSEVSRVLEKERVWVMGWSATYETYMKFLSRFPMLDKDWDLQLLPITSVRPAGMSGLATTTTATTRPQSLMESFVPFGGFFPAAYESNVPVIKPPQTSPRCQHCNDKYEQELAAILKGHSPSLEDQHQANLPSWLRSVDIVSMNNALDATKAKDDDQALTARVRELRKKWSDHCWRLHQGFPNLETNQRQLVPPLVGLPYVSDKERAVTQDGISPSVTQSQIGFTSALPFTVGLQKITTMSQSISMPVVPEPLDKDLISRLQARVSKSEQLRTEGFQSHQGSLPDFGIHDDHTSPSSATSVMTDLVLGPIHETFCTRNERAGDLALCSPSKKISEFSQCPTLLGSKACLRASDICEKFDPSNFKTFYTNLLEKVGRQEEAICAISQAIVRCRTGYERRRGASFKGDIWLSFLGPDRFAKKKAASALAELMFGSRENLICIDLSYQDSIHCPNSICDQREVNKYDVKYRGKTVADQIAGEVSRNPQSVVFLENVDGADLLVQNSLSRAIHTGKISDSHGREFNISNAIFVLTATAIRGNTSSPANGSTNFSEERILAAQGRQMKFLVESIPGAIRISPNVNVFIAPRLKSGSKEVVSKRKLNVTGNQKDQHESFGALKRVHKMSNSLLDLNLPVEEAKEEDTDCSSSISGGGGGDELWLEEFLGSMDETVNFKPFDFDTLADHVLKEISKRFCKAFGTGFLMEIDVEVMEQILAASWLLEDIRDLSNWLDEVLCRSFMELRQRYSNKLSARTAVRLVACEEYSQLEEHAPGVLLPSRIILD